VQLSALAGGDYPQFCSGCAWTGHQPSYLSLLIFSLDFHVILRYGKPRIRNRYRSAILLKKKLFTAVILATVLNMVTVDTVTYYYYYYYYYYTIWMSLVTGLFFPVLLLNQQ
jgi:hypothetical protein